MDAKAAILAMKAVSYGIDKVPDTLFDKIPGGYFKAKEQEAEQKLARSEQKKRDQHNRSNSRSPSRSGYSSDAGSDQEERARRRRERARRNSTMPRSPSSERGYDDYRNQRHGVHWVDGGRDARNASPQQPYFDPPPREEVTSPYKPYNPAEYASPGGGNDPRTNGYGQSPVGPNTYQPPFSPPPEAPYPPAPRSTAEARYRPANYTNYTPSPITSPQYPSNTFGQQFGPPAATSQKFYASNTPRPTPFYRQPSYSNPDVSYDVVTSERVYKDRRDRDSRDDSRSRSRDQPREQPRDQFRDQSRERDRGESRSARSRSKRSSSAPRGRSNVREKISHKMKEIPHDQRNLVASIAGAVAGGMLGKGVGHGTLSTALGAAIGGLAVGGLEKRHDDKKKKTHDRRDSGHSREKEERARNRNRHDNKTRTDEVFDSDPSDGGSD